MIEAGRLEQPDRPADKFGFCFELDSLDQVEPWGEPGQGRLHWFGLTSGRYWINTHWGQVLRYTTDFLKLSSYPSCYAEYQVARLFEDLQQCLPSVLEPVPEDIAAVVSIPGWTEHLSPWSAEECESAERERRWELYESAMGWWDRREIDTAYLRFGPRFQFWRVGETVCFRWTTENNSDQGAPVFLVPNGKIELSADEFRQAAFGFCEAVLSAMSSRVHQIRLEGWSRSDCELDVDALVSEHRSRERRFGEMRRQVSITDWAKVRTHLNLLVDRVGLP